MGRRRVESAICSGEVMKHRKQIPRIVWLAACAAASGLSGCSNERKAEAASPEPASNVQTTVAQRMSVPDWLEAVGTVRAAQTSQLASQVMGNIVTVHVHEGDRVERGQVMAVIDDAQPRASVEQATAAEIAAQKELSATESEYALAAITLKRYQPLYERQTVSAQTFDEVKTRAQSAEARRDMARAALAQADAALAQARTGIAAMNGHGWPATVFVPGTFASGSSRPPPLSREHCRR